MKKFSRLVLLLVVTVVLGVVAGAVCWAFFFLMNQGIALVWTVIPEALAGPQPWWPLVICVIGGLLVGLFQKRFPGQPEEMDEVLAQVKATGRYEYKTLFVGFAGALLPLLFGGCLGPEAGLTGVIAGLCTWVGDRLKFLGKEFRDLSGVGIAAIVSAMFSAPLFGLAVPIFGSAEGQVEGTIRVPKALKLAVYLLAIASALATMLGLGALLGGMGGLPHYSEGAVSGLEMALLLPLALLGGLVGFVFHGAGALAAWASSILGDRPVLKGILAGVILGALGMVLPYTMFAGELQAEELDGLWTTLPAIVLVATAFLKPVTLQMCLGLGWRGGKFFPMIFSGISLGYGMALLTGADPVFCLCACTAGVLGCMMRQPLMAVLLLFLCFPVSSLFTLLAAAVIGSAIPLPKAWQPPRKQGLRRAAETKDV